MHSEDVEILATHVSHQDILGGGFLLIVLPYIHTCMFLMWEVYSYTFGDRVLGDELLQLAGFSLLVSILACT